VIVNTIVKAKEQIEEIVIETIDETATDKINTIVMERIATKKINLPVKGISKKKKKKKKKPTCFLYSLLCHRHRDRSADKDRKKKEKKPSYDDEEPTHSDLRPSLDDLGYSNVNNPFNDINLENKFVWGKKNHRDKKELGLSSNDLRQRERERKREADDELAKLNKRRAEREREIELREEEMARIQRDAELAQMGDWEAKEEEVKK
jgi:hypothetical protein